MNLLRGKNVWLIMLLGLLLSLGLVFGCGPADDSAPDETPTGTEDTDRVIKLGYSAPLSGGQAGFGQGSRFGMEKALQEQIDLHGGIYIAEYDAVLPVELIVLDNESAGTNAAATTADLILRYEVDLMVIGAETPGQGIPNSTTADDNQTPMIINFPIEPFWTAGPYEYVWNTGFRVFTPIPEGDFRHGLPGYTIVDNYRGITDMVVDQTNGTVGIICADDADGRQWFEGLKTIQDDIDLTIVGIDEMFGLYPPGTEDFTPIINRWIEEGVEITWGVLPAGDAATLLRQAEGLGWKPKLFIASKAGLFYEDMVAYGGDLPLGNMCTTWWWYEYPAEHYPGVDPNTTPDSLMQGYMEQTNSPINPAVGIGYSHMQIAIDALERAGTLDKDAINEAIKTTELQTMMGRVSFMEETSDSPAALFVGQWFKVEGEEYEWVMRPVYSAHEQMRDMLVEPLFPRP